MQYISGAGISVRRIWPTRLQGVFVVKVALSSCSWPQPPNFSRIRRKKIAGRKSAGKYAASRKSAEKVRQPAEYKKKIRLGSITWACVERYHKLRKLWSRPLDETWLTPRNTLLSYIVLHILEFCNRGRL